MIEKTVHLAEFRETKQSAIFLAKFDIGIGQGKITVKLKYFEYNLEKAIKKIKKIPW